MSPIIATDTGSGFTPPPPGLYAAVVVDVVNLGMQESRYGKKPKVTFALQLEEINPETEKRFVVYRRFTRSLHKESSLRPWVETLLGGKLIDVEARSGFDLEKLIGACCQVQIAHKTVDGRTYGNIIGVVPLAKGMQQLRPLDYTRVQDRTENGARATS